MRAAILQSLRDMINHNSDEKHIIFLWDYVYHFAYDRKSLLLLFQFFVELYREWKHVYVLAGNHDWIADHFVYEEAQQAFSIINDYVFEQSRTGEGLSEKGSLRFITEPITLTIEDQDVIFFPYNLALSPEEESFSSTDVWLSPVVHSLRELAFSNNKRERYSLSINLCLLELVAKLRHTSSCDTIVVFHHYYVESTEFPGQTSRFAFKDVALSKEWLSVNDIRMISGHLHQAFVYQNYLCVGSVRSTSPLEFNHYKVACVLHWSFVRFYPSHINYYLRTFYEWRVLDSALLLELLQQQYDDSRLVFQSNVFFTLDTDSLRSFPDFSLLSLQIVGDSLDYWRITDYIDGTLFPTVETVRLKRQDKKVEQLLQQLDISSRNLQTWFHDWKSILKDYIGIKYSSEQQYYFALLEDLHLL